MCNSRHKCSNIALIWSPASPSSSALHETEGRAWKVTLSPAHSSHTCGAQSRTRAIRGMLDGGRALPDICTETQKNADHIQALMRWSPSGATTGRYQSTWAETFHLRPQLSQLTPKSRNALTSETEHPHKLSKRKRKYLKQRSSITG